MDNETAIQILDRAIPVLDRAAKVEAVHSPEMRSMIRGGIREYKAAVKHLKKELRTRDREAADE